MKSQRRLLESFRCLHGTSYLFSYAQKEIKEEAKQMIWVGYLTFFFSKEHACYFGFSKYSARPTIWNLPPSGMTLLTESQNYSMVDGLQRALTTIATKVHTSLAIGQSKKQVLNGFIFCAEGTFSLPLPFSLNQIIHSQNSILLH